MPLTKEEEELFRELRRKRDREYAKLRRDKTRKKKYGERTTRKINSDIGKHLMTLSKIFTPPLLQTKMKDLQTQKKKRKTSIEK
jgi:hypothetical protein